MNFSFLAKYWLYYLIGIKNTVLLALFTVAFGVLIGIVLVLGRISKQKWLRFISTAYVEFIRGTPLLVQLFIIYYGLPALGIKFPNNKLLSSIIGMPFSDFIPGVITLAINSGAYICEIFRSGIQAIEIGQTEAARSLGLSYRQTLRLIIFPQAFKTALPTLGNEFIAVIKESSIVSVIGIADLMYKANVIRGNTFLPFEPLLIAALCYFLLTYPLSKLLGYIEKRMKYA
ncbi:amino acid ABC transporter permease [Treponema phagedenis]|uniref:Putative glutamine transport system permease protein GlnP n=1 Tax=Treponema phagedenis TaxID=162 RepID=A0A0B7GWK8_TREPH|nr:amino acid ABC transporter permease [Treponema phagedenis]EFW36758.1 ABC transporter, permease protein [Treponema phagedenis F0421]NVP25061.1 amino acid ABC transporter permease [Treponema phagedenis]QEJ94027.1 amino acid ABC transporter permease [Treponema phagedenis]QEJ97175.1 amino acid ABC transporter permease [Treponema phagedenis]QEK01965.1 amino acid ABC transporter permease [Treponema phagedenis]